MTGSALAGDIQTLHLYPHALRAANSYYSPAAHGILFGYFRADAKDPGSNLPGQTIFTCLSHDIVAHETTHAIVDGIRTYFSEHTNQDVPALHEAFADLAALFRHFSHREVLLDTIQRTGGKLYAYQLQSDAVAAAPVISAELARQNPLVAMAQQFGEASGLRGGLRSALGTPPNAAALARSVEPHDRGSILVAAVFDAFFSIYVKRTANLFRLYRAGGGGADKDDLPMPLALLLSEEVTRTADRFFGIGARSIDYCPPVDVTFGDFLRAVITAHNDFDPADDEGVCDALMQAFRLHGILPEGAAFFSEDALCWPRAEGLPRVRGLAFGGCSGLTAAQRDANRRALQRYADDPGNRSKLALDPALEVIIPSFHTVFREGPDGMVRVDLVVEMIQTRERPFVAAEPDLGHFPHRGGATLIISAPGLTEGTEGQRPTTKGSSAT